MKKATLLSLLFVHSFSMAGTGIHFRSMEGLRFDDANQCDWSVTIPVNTTHPGGNRGGRLQERNYGIIFGCQVRENYPITIFGLPFERGYQIGSFRNSQNQSLHLVGVSGRITALSFQEPLFRKEMRFVFGLKTSAGAYVLRNGSDVVYGVLPTHNRGLFMATSKYTRFGLVEERVVVAGIRTRMIVFEGSF